MTILGIHTLPGAIFKMTALENDRKQPKLGLSALENDRKPKLGFYITQLLYTINLQYWTLNVCFWKWQILLN